MLRCRTGRRTTNRTQSMYLDHNIPRSNTRKIMAPKPVQIQTGSLKQPFRSLSKRTVSHFAEHICTARAQACCFKILLAFWCWFDSIQQQAASFQPFATRSRRVFGIHHFRYCDGKERCWFAGSSGKRATTLLLYMHALGSSSTYAFHRAALSATLRVTLTTLPCNGATTRPAWTSST